MNGPFFFGYVVWLLSEDALLSDKPPLLSDSAGLLADKTLLLSDNATLLSEATFTGKSFV